MKIPLAEFTNKTVDLELLVNEFGSEIEEKFNMTDFVLEKIDIIEKKLIELIDIKLVPPNQINEIFNIFYMGLDNIRVNHFCKQYDINQRKLERIFNKYIGISPKSFQKINRFQRILNQMVKSKHIDLTSLAYDYQYYDQTHFIKDFKLFTGCSPSHFLKERRSIKEITEHN